MTREIRTYGLSESALRQRLDDLLTDTEMAVTLSFEEGHGIVTVTADSEVLEDVVDELAVRMGGFIYSYEGESLAAVVVRLLAVHKLTIATAESCTGGMIAAALTDVPGASRVFGTGVVSYSNACKERLLTVSAETLDTLGAVSAETAGQMARGVRQQGDASIGVAVTGEAGPVAAENLPVGTVFIALADKKRTWVEELHLDGPDRAAIRRQAADSVLWLVWRYVSAYPAVMAGGENNFVAQKRTIPKTQGSGQPRLLSLLLPWKGDSRRRLAVKMVAWLVALAMLIGALVMGYQYLVQPQRNLELQESLGDLYWEESTDLTGDTADADEYPDGLMPVFRGLYDMNKDVGGWLHIPGTGVDYPVMNYTDGFYENHSFLKEYSIYGQPYFGEVVTRNTRLIYGQNTGDGQMFSELLNYQRVAYLQEHSLIECNTVYANEKWQIFAVVVLDDRHPEEFDLPVNGFEDEEAFLAYLDQVRERSLFISDVAVTEQDSLLVLSTNAQQEYGFSGARFAVFARLVGDGVTESTYRVNNQAKMPAAMERDTPTTTRAVRTTRTTATTTTTATTVVTTESTTVTTEADAAVITTETAVDTSATENASTSVTDVMATDAQPEESTTTETETTALAQSTASTETTLPTEGTTIPTEETGMAQ